MAKIISGFDLLRNKPIDSRYTKNNISGRDAIDVNYRYHGLKVYVLSENKEYVWDATNSAWILYWEQNQLNVGTRTARYLSYFNDSIELTSSGIYYYNNRVGLLTNDPKGTLQIGSSDAIVIDDSNKSIMYNTFNNSGKRALNLAKGSSSISFLDDKILVSSRYSGTGDAAYNEGILVGLSPLLSSPLNAVYNRNFFLSINNTTPSDISNILQIHSRENGVSTPMSISLTGTNTVGFVGLNVKMLNPTSIQMFDNTKNAGGLFISDKLSLYLKNSTNSILPVIEVSKQSTTFNTAISGGLSITGQFTFPNSTPMPDITTPTNLQSCLNYFYSNISNIKLDIININNEIDGLNDFQNIYNNDGSLDSDRVITLNNKNISFKNGIYGIDITSDTTNIVSNNYLTLRTSALRSDYVRLETGLITDIRTVRFPDKNITIAGIDDIVRSDWNETNTNSKSFILNKPSIANTTNNVIYVDQHNPVDIPNGTILSPYHSIEEAISHIIGNGTNESPEFVNYKIHVRQGEYIINAEIDLVNINITFDNDCSLFCNSKYLFKYTGLTDYKLKIFGYPSIICDKFIDILLDGNSNGFIYIEADIIESSGADTSDMILFALHSNSTLKTYFTLNLRGTITTAYYTIFDINGNVDAYISGLTNKSSLKVSARYDDPNAVNFHDVYILNLSTSSENIIKVCNVEMYRNEGSSAYININGAYDIIDINSCSFHGYQYGQDIEFIYTTDIITANSLLFRNNYISNTIYFRKINSTYSWTNTTETIYITVSNGKDFEHINCHINNTVYGSHVAHFALSDNITQNGINFYSSMKTRVFTYMDDTDAILNGLIAGDIYSDPTGVLRMVL